MSEFVESALPLFPVRQVSVHEAFEDFPVVWGEQVEFANPDLRGSIPAFLAWLYRFPLPKTS